MNKRSDGLIANESAHVFRPGTARWLSSLGHPGYSPATASAVWAEMRRSGCDVWRALDRVAR
jgi:hypothetical protein